MKRFLGPRARLMAVALVAALAAACGGGDDDHESWKAEADRLREQAVDMSSTRPCDRDSHCDGLKFGSPVPTCQQYDEVAYSLLAPGARAAELLAAQQREAARHARRHAPGGDQIVCPAIAQPAPTYHCVDNRCVQRQGTFAAALAQPLQR